MGQHRIVLIDNGSGGYTPRQVRVRNRLWAKSQSGRLDRDLAAGRMPESSVAMAWWAEHLVSAASRGQLAGELDHLARRADRLSGGRTAKVPVCAGRVRSAGSALRAVSDRLSGPTLVAPRGIAMLRVLLADGCGPLFCRRSDDDLPEALRAACAALEPI